jgi:hypothetical protein
MKKRGKVLPLTFLRTQQDFKKRLSSFWANKLIDGKRNELPKHNALLYTMAKEFESFVTQENKELEKQLIEKMGSDSNWIILLPEYGKKVCFNIDIKSIDILEMDMIDWKQYDKKCNDTFLKKE